MTLRPCREESVDFDNTKNLYIEGDNLEALKILRETYLGKVKMIYIDPPYNTGNDFVYNDDFKMSSSDYSGISGEVDEKGNHLVPNAQSNGRFHTDWLNMIYPRLKLSKDLLSEDGLIFISIDSNEKTNLQIICNEVYGEANYVTDFVWRKTSNPNSTGNNIGVEHEFIIVYSKSNNYHLNLLELSAEDLAKYTGKDEYYETRGPFKLVGLNKTGTINDLRPNLTYTISAPDGSIIEPQPRWRWSKEKLEKGIRENRVVFSKTNNKWTVYYKQYLNEDNDGNLVERGNLIKTILMDNGRTTDGTLEINRLLGKGYFDFPKPSSLIEFLVKIATNKKNDIVMDFFSGSGTTAHAVMQMNAKDGLGRKFIMIQLQEECDQESEAYKTGYRNICEIGKERIRRAGKAVKAEYKQTSDSDLDIGFRVFKLADSNMNDVFYEPDKVKKDILEYSTDNVKLGRTSEDLLIQSMLELGCDLSASIDKKIVDGAEVLVVDHGYLVACYDAKVSESVVKNISKEYTPQYAVFRNSTMESDSMLSNIEQIFKTYSPQTDICIL